MMRSIWSTIAAVAVGAIALPAFFDLPRIFVWNASPSVPIGLYRLRPVDPLAFHDLVTIAATGPLAAFIAERGYLPQDIPLIKQVNGLPGQIVCRTGRTVTVDGTQLGAARDTDSLGRPMPIWNGCHRLTEDEVFLMNPGVENSLDGRYFGPFRRNAILGQATPLWVGEDPIARGPSPSTAIGHASASPNHTP